MVALARLNDIPARVAIGFTPGELVGDNTYAVTNKDAHSWPELWFPQAGWVRFEPTPRGDDATDPPAYAQQDPGTPAPSASDSSVLPKQDQPKTQDTPDAAAGAEASAAPTGAASGGGGSGSLAALGWTVLGLALVALLLVPGAARRQRRARRLRGGPDTAHLRWAEVTDTARDLGLLSPATLSPRRLVGRWANAENGERTLPDTTARVLRRLAADEEMARYAPPGDAGGVRPAGVAAGSAPPPVSETELRTAFQAWVRSAGALTRYSALLAPRSLLDGVLVRVATLLRRVLRPISAWTAACVQRIADSPLARRARSSGSGWTRA